MRLLLSFIIFVLCGQLISQSAIPQKKCSDCDNYIVTECFLEVDTVRNVWIDIGRDTLGRPDPFPSNPIGGTGDGFTTQITSCGGGADFGGNPVGALQFSDSTTKPDNLLSYGDQSKDSVGDKCASICWSSCVPVDSFLVCVSDVDAGVVLNPPHSDLGSLPQLESVEVIPGTYSSVEFGGGGNFIMNILPSGNELWTPTNNNGNIGFWITKDQGCFEIIQHNDDNSGSTTLWQGVVHDQKILRHENSCDSTDYFYTDIEGNELSVEESNVYCVPFDCTSLPSPSQYIDCDSIKVYSWNISPGVIEKIWDNTTTGDITHEDPSQIFTGLNEGDCLSPAHPKDPAIIQVVPDWVDNTANSPNDGEDNYSYEGWLFVEQDSTYFQDVNGNTGELFDVFVDGTLVYSRPSVTVGSDRGSNGLFVCLNEGWHHLLILGSDNGAFAGIQLQDSSSVATWANFNGLTSTTTPVQECRNEDCNYIIQANEFSCPQPIPSCSFGGYPGSGGGADEQTLINNDVNGVTESITISNGNTIPINHPDVLLPEACTQVALLESDNNESEGSWSRTGNIGTSENYARCDHQHPIVRIPNPGDPVINISGATILQQAILDRESTEEWYAYKFRVRVTGMTAGAGWDFLTIPNIAGFQRPMITGIGNYRPASTTPQEDVDLPPNTQGFTGAAPRGPYMGKEWHEWSSTQRLYNGFFRKDNDITNDYVEFWVKYIRL